MPNHHPETKENEYYCYNVKAEKGIPLRLRSLKTVRLGKQAYDLDGKKISTDYMLPLFVSKNELNTLNNIHEQELKEIRSK